MNRLSHYHDPMTGGPPPLPRKGILLSPPRPGQSRPLVHHPGLLGHGVHGGGHHGGGGGHHGPGMHGMSEFSSSGPASLPWGGSAPPQRGLVRPIPGRGRGGGEGATARGGPQKDPGGGNSRGPWGSPSSPTAEPVSALANGSGNRIRPERSGRKLIQKFQFSSDTEGGEEGKGRILRGGRRRDAEVTRSRQMASLSIADMSPRLALQRILALFERGEQREAAAFLHRLSLTTFRQILPDLPTDLFVESLPQSLPVLEALYAKLFLAGGKQLPAALSVSPETVIWQLVKFFACQEDQSLASREGRWELCGPFINTCKRLLSVLLTAEPRLRRTVADRKRLLTKVIEGLGQHGMVGSADQSLMNLHDGLRIEFHKVKEQYQGAIAKLDELALSSKEPVTNSSAGVKAPVLSSHQRQLSLQMSQVQERLIKNKTLLTAIEPAISCTSLEVLIGILQRRIELDKEVLFQFTTIKRETKLVDKDDKNPTIAPTLMKFQRGCHQVLELMKEVKEDEEEEEEEEVEEENSDISGYHSDSDSTVMMSGNSPFISKTARYNFLSRSVRLGSKHTARTALAPTEGYSSSSGFSSLPPSQLSPLPSSPSSSSASPAESSSSQPDSDSACSLEEREVGRGKTRVRASKSNKGKTDCPNCQVEGEKSVGMEREVERLGAELASTRQTILRMHEREEKMKERLMDLRLKSEEQISITSSSTSAVYLSVKGRGGPPGPPGSPRGGSQGSRREAARLVAKYGELYSQARLDTLDALDELKELSSAEELKNKLLFSVVVLSFRSVLQSIALVRQQVAAVLQVPPSPGLGDEETHVTELRAAVERYLRESSTSFNLDRNCEEVLSQICSTLFDYPAIRECEELVRYIRNCVNTAWGLSTQCPVYLIEYEERQFRSEMHVRFHSSVETSTAVRTYLWPALREGRQGPVVHKAVVIT